MKAYTYIIGILALLLLAGPVHAATWNSSAQAFDIHKRIFVYGQSANWDLAANRTSLSFSAGWCEKDRCSSEKGVFLPLDYQFDPAVYDWDYIEGVQFDYCQVYTHDGLYMDFWDEQDPYFWAPANDRVLTWNFDNSGGSVVNTMHGKRFTWEQCGLLSVECKTWTPEKVKMIKAAGFGDYCSVGAEGETCVFKASIDGVEVNYPSAGCDSYACTSDDVSLYSRSSCGCTGLRTPDDSCVKVGGTHESLNNSVIGAGGQGSGDAGFLSQQLGGKYSAEFASRFSFMKLLLDVAYYLFNLLLTVFYVVEFALVFWLFFVVVMKVFRRSLENIKIIMGGGKRGA